MRSFPLLAALVALCMVGACRRKSAEQPVTAPNDRGVAQMPALGSGLVAELAREATDRPAGTPTVEQILAALEAAGQPIARKQQVLATPLGAHYCLVAATGNGLSLSICEFDSELAAKAGQAASLEAWKVIPRRTLALNRKTLLTVIRPSDAAQMTSDGEGAQKIFTAL